MSAQEHTYTDVFQTFDRDARFIKYYKQTM